MLVFLPFCVLPYIGAAESSVSGARTWFVPNSGMDVAQAPFQDGLVALHNFWYEEARERFIESQYHDPGFGLAYWAEAMTYDNAFGTVPGSENELLGAQVLARINKLDGSGKLRLDEKERGLLEALQDRFDDSSDVDTRRNGYAIAMQALAQRYPGDIEIALFSSLAMMARPEFDRNRPEHVTTVAGVLEPIFEANPGHPGVLHYLVHLYDSPAFAQLGLRQALLYTEIASNSSHALHMPSHIFRHLGRWEEVVDANEAAWKASVEWQSATNRPLNARDYHALEWHFDALLELKRFDEAGRVIVELEQIRTLMEERGQLTGDVPHLIDKLRGFLERGTSG
jgi:hypothetical protein